jgi:hypothetical protein
MKNTAPSDLATRTGSRAALYRTGAPTGVGEEYPGGMSFTVSFTGQGKDGGIVVDSLRQAITRVRQLEEEQFPAAIWEIPDDEDHGNGRLVGKYSAPPDRASAA